MNEHVNAAFDMALASYRIQPLQRTFPTETPRRVGFDPDELVALREEWDDIMAEYRKLGDRLTMFRQHAGCMGLWGGR